MPKLSLSGLVFQAWAGGDTRLSDWQLVVIAIIHCLSWMGKSLPKCSKLVLLGLFALMISNSDSFACRVFKPLLPEHIKASNVVFRGTIVGFRPIERGPILLSFRVEKTYRGKHYELREVLWQRWGGPEYPISMSDFLRWYGNDVLMFASSGTDGKIWVTQTSCGPSSAIFRWSKQNVPRALETGVVK